MKVLRRFLAIAALVSWTTAAHAQGASNEAAAQALFDEGRALVQAGKYAEACPKFAESERLSPGAGTLLNLGACYEKNGQTASAWATYADAASEAKNANRPDWATRAKQRMTALAPDLSKLSIVVPADTARASGLEIKRDGIVVGQTEWGLAIPVDPGQHVVEAKAPGFKKWSTVVQVGTKRDQVSQKVPALEAEPVETPPPSRPQEIAPPPVEQSSSHPPDTSRGNAQRAVGIGAAAGGVVGIGVGIVFGLFASGNKSDAEPNCNADLSACNGAGVDAMKSARTDATISTIGFVAGGALLVGGAALYLTAPRNEPVKTIGLAVTPGPGGASVSLGGAW